MNTFSIAKCNLAVNYSKAPSVTQIPWGFYVCITLIFYELLIYIRKGRHQACIVSTELVH